MPKKKWSELNHLQLGKYAEYYAKMEFTSYGYDVYTSEVDDHGVDFVARDKTGNYIEVQVKSIRKDNYVFIRKDKITLDEKHFVCYLRFVDDQLPEVYVIPATVWKEPNSLFVDYQYDKPGQTGKPEYGINLSKKTLPMLQAYTAEKILG